MGWMGGDMQRDTKFLVDLERHTFISEKSHQEIIDVAGLNPGGYDNYLKGWVKNDGTIKIWVQTVEDLVFRYWDQVRLGFRQLVKKELTNVKAKIYAIVNRVDRYAGTVGDILEQHGGKNAYLTEQLGYAVLLAGQQKLAVGAEVKLLVNWKLTADRYLLAGTNGKVVSAAGPQSKQVRVTWRNSYNGILRSRGRFEQLTDRRLITPV